MFVPVLQALRCHFPASSLWKDCRCWSSMAGHAGHLGNGGNEHGMARHDGMYSEYVCIYIYICAYIYICTYVTACVYIDFQIYTYAHMYILYYIVLLFIYIYIIIYIYIFKIQNHIEAKWWFQIFIEYSLCFILRLIVIQSRSGNSILDIWQSGFR